MFLCKLCQSDVPKRRFMQHCFIIHVNEQLYPCPYSECLVKCTNINKLKVHISRRHTSAHTANKYESIICVRCNHTNFTSVNELLNHIRIIHIMKNHECMTCCFSNCLFSTNNAGTWKSHMSRCHFVLTDVLRDCFKQEIDSTLNVQPISNCDEEVRESGINGDNIICVDSSSKRNIEKSLAHFFLKMLVKWQIPENAIQEILDTFVELHGLSVEEMCYHVKDFLPFDLQTQKDILYQFTADKSALSTNYRRLKYFTKHLPYVGPSKF